jgi:predicted alpha-1,2-mannosidase
MWIVQNALLFKRLRASLVFLLVAIPQVEPLDLTQYVLPTVCIDSFRVTIAHTNFLQTGSSNGGNTFTGVCLPFGMVKLGPDVTSGSDSYSGYSSLGNFTGFSMMHESGTGGAPKYGVVSQMPFIGKLTTALPSISDTRAAPDITSVGYYKATLGSNITVELSATSRAGFYQYNFPAESQPHIIVNVSHVLPSKRLDLSQHYVGGNINISNNFYEGYGDYDNGWNRSPTWRIFFCGYFDVPAITVQTFVGSNGSLLLDSNSISSTAQTGAVFTFNTTKITSRVGISFISTTRACSNVNSQIPAGTTLSTLTSNARQIWNDDVLSKVVTTEGDVNKLELLYTSMFHMHLIPSNRTGENPLWSSAEPYYDDTFTLWDLFRCTFSLLHILQPTMHLEYVRSLIDIWRHEGYMPDARSSNFNGATQGGTNSDNVLADAYVKGVRGSINWTAGYEAMVKNAEVTPVNNNDPRDPSSSTKEGRGALPDWLEHGYITTKYGRSVTRAVEYSVNDFSLYQVAKALGKTSDSKKYLNRSRNWRNHWNPNATALNFTGFVVPRTTSGFVTQDPLKCGGCYWADAYYEALPWEYSFNVHHDINTLIALCNGSKSFIDRLEATFEPGIYAHSRFNDTIFNPGNEPSFTTPYLYNFVGRQDLSVKHSRFIAKTYYAPTPDGLPGNSDAGSMESWLIWNMLGLYPIVGQTTFLIGSPWFANTTISLGSGKQLIVTTTGGSDTSYYVQSLSVNGKVWDQSWLTWNDIFANGGTMAFALGPEPQNWTTGNSPPSPASEYDQGADPTAIVNPSTITMAPSGTEALQHAARRRLLRDIALGVTGSGVFILGLLGMAIWWFYLRRKRILASSFETQKEAEAGDIKDDCGLQKVQVLEGPGLGGRDELMIEKENITVASREINKT